MPHPLENELQVALQAVREGALAARRVRSQLVGQVLEKDDRSPVTVADFAAQALIASRLAATFPADPLVAEEDAAALRAPQNAALLARVVDQVAPLRTAATAPQVCDWIDQGGRRITAERFWTLDPIDGTAGFVRGGQYAVCLALVENGQVVLGVLGCPALGPSYPAGDESGFLFYAVRGQGSWQLPLTGSGEPQAIHVSPEGNPARARSCESLASSNQWREDAEAVSALLGGGAAPLRLDSQAKYAMVARGEAEIYWRLPKVPARREKIWDHASGVILVEEAGGQVSDALGKPLDFSRGHALEANHGLIATNGLLHAAVLEAVTAVWGRSANG